MTNEAGTEFDEPTFELWDRVVKVSGYSFPGIILSKFLTYKQETRYVVECVAIGAAGCLHIFSGKQLRLMTDTEVQHYRKEASNNGKTIV